jgi:hypothetical protein
VIDSSRTNPTLSHFGLYKSPPTVRIEPDGGAFERSLRVRLSCDSRNAAIFYTLDGSEPTLKSKRYIEPIDLTRSALVRAACSVGGDLAAEISEARFTKCLKTKSVVFEKPYSAKYPGRGDTTITDGRRGSLNFQDKEWLGFDGDDVVATIDLGESKAIHKIAIGCLQQQGSWIFLPTEVKFIVSSDGINWKTVGNQSNAVKQKESVVARDFSTAVKDVSARYVRVAAKNVGTCPPWHPGAGDKAWLFVDEVVVE